MKKWLVLWALAAGCFVPPSNDKDVLIEQVRNYHDAIRWRRFGEAASQLPPERRQKFLDDALAAKEEIEVADYEIVRTESRAKDKTEIRVAFEWESKRTGLLQKTSFIETWQKLGKVWILIAARKSAGEPLALLAGMVTGP